MRHFSPKQRTPLRSAYQTTGADLASALLGQKRVKQTVRVVTTDTYQGKPISHIVLVVPAGKEQGDYWHVSAANLWRIEAGVSPDDVGCELADAQSEPIEYPDEDRAASAADASYQSRMEQF